jgi:hypothetical protein
MEILASTWRYAATVAALGVSLSACSPGPQGEEWRVAAVLDDPREYRIIFVEIDSASVKKPAVYRDAASELCSKGECWQLAFYPQGDPLPPHTTRRAWGAAGNYKYYPPVATYFGNTREFARWDCDRIGAEGSPLNALCGFREQYGAVLALASRDGWVRGCGLPPAPVSGRTVVERYAASLPPDRRAQILAAYDKHLLDSESGPSDPGICKKSRAIVETDAREARLTLAK